MREQRRCEGGYEGSKTEKRCLRACSKKEEATALLFALVGPFFGSQCSPQSRRCHVLAPWPTMTLRSRSPAGSASRSWRTRLRSFATILSARFVPKTGPLFKASTSLGTPLTRPSTAPSRRTVSLKSTSEIQTVRSAEDRSVCLSQIPTKIFSHSSSV